MAPQRVDDDLRSGGEPSEHETPDEQRVVDVQDWVGGRKSGIIEMICDWLTNLKRGISSRTFRKYSSGIFFRNHEAAENSGLNVVNRLISKDR